MSGVMNVEENETPYEWMYKFIASINAKQTYN